MITIWCKRNVLLLATLTAVSSVGFTQVQVKPQEPMISYSSKLVEMLKASSVVTLSLGPTWESAGHTQTLYLAPNIEKTYAANHALHALVNGELFLGIQKPLHEQLNGQIGITVTRTGNAALSGNIWDDADAQFNNYTYNYQVKHTHVAIKGKLLADKGYIITPWLSGS